MENISIKPHLTLAGGINGYMGQCGWRKARQAGYKSPAVSCQKVMTELPLLETKRSGVTAIAAVWLVDSIPAAYIWLCNRTGDGLRKAS